MTVYIDDARIWGRSSRTRRSVRYSHLFADTQAELIDFAARLGMHDSWIRSPGTYREHFVVTETKRQQALILGARSIPYRLGTAELLRNRKTAQQPTQEGQPA